MRSRRPLPQPDPAERTAVDWWVRAVPAVVVVHAVGLLVLYARPGRLALWMWYLGPIFLAVVTIVLLVGSLRSGADGVTASTAGTYWGTSPLFSWS